MGQQSANKAGRKVTKAESAAVKKTMQDGLKRLRNDEDARKAAEEMCDTLRDGIMEQLQELYEDLQQVYIDDQGAALAGAYFVLMHAGIGAAVRAGHTLGITPAGFQAACRDRFAAEQMVPTRVEDDRERPNL